MNQPEANQSEISLLKRMGGPDGFGYILYVLGFVLTLAAWLPVPPGGIDLGVLKIPALLEDLKQILRVVGPFCLLLAFLLHVPLNRQKLPMIILISLAFISALLVTLFYTPNFQSRPPMPVTSITILSPSPNENLTVAPSGTVAIRGELRPEAHAALGTEIHVEVRDSRSGKLLGKTSLRPLRDWRAEFSVSSGTRQIDVAVVFKDGPNKILATATVTAHLQRKE